LTRKAVSTRLYNRRWNKTDLVSRGVRVGILSLVLIIVSMMCNGLQSAQHSASGALYATSESTQAVYLQKKPIHALCDQARQNTAYLAYAVTHHDDNNNQQSFDRSLLPPGFCDDFSPRGLWEELFPGDQSYDAYSWDFARRVAEERTQGNNDQKTVERAYLRRWKEYNNCFFRQFIKSLSVYDDYTVAIADQLQHDATFRDNVAHASQQAVSEIIFEAQRIAQARQRIVQQKRAAQQQFLQKQQHDITAAVYQQQSSERAQHAAVWKRSNPARASAYEKTLVDGSFTDQSFTLSSSADKLLKNCQHDSHSYRVLHGNALHHELMQEIINGIEQLAQVSSEVQKDPFAQQLRNEAVNMFDDARQTISMGDCIGAAALVDCGNIITFHLSHILEVTHAFVEGCAHGVRDAVIGTAYCVLHPVKSVQHFAQATCVLAEKIAPYLPPHVPEIDDVQGWNHYMEQCDQVARTWQKAAHDLRETFDKTPTIDLAKGIARTVGHMGTNIFVTHSMTRLTSTLARCAVQPTILAAHTYVEATLAACRPARLFLKNLERVYKRMRRSYKRLTNKIAEYGRRLYTLDEIETESVALAQSTGEIALTPRDLPHNMMQQCASEKLVGSHPKNYKKSGKLRTQAKQKIAQINEPGVTNSANSVAAETPKQDPVSRALEYSRESVVRHIITTGERFGYSPEAVMQAITTLENQQGCAATFLKAVQEFENIPGVNEVIEKIFKHGSNCGVRVKGAFNELRMALKLKDEGHTILEFCKRVGEKEYDILTTTHLIECKDVAW